MTYLSPVQTDQASHRAWPVIPEGMNGVQIVAVARMVERVCGTAAAASYLAEAISAFDRKARSARHTYLSPYGGPAEPAEPHIVGATSPPPHATRS